MSLLVIGEIFRAARAQCRFQTTLYGSELTATKLEEQIQIRRSVLRLMLNEFNQSK
jgi:hypothetical protein